MLSMIICSYGPNELIHNTSCAYNHEMYANLPNILECLLLLTDAMATPKCPSQNESSRNLYFPVCNDKTY